MALPFARALPAAALPAMLLVAVACSSNNSHSSGNAPANIKASVPAGSPAAAAPSGPVTLTETDNKFSQTSITIKAGQPATVNVMNTGQAVHNWHVIDVKDDSGKDIMTPLAEGGKTNSVTFTVSKPGTYNFHCDAHPDEMKGQLLVQ